MTSAASTLVTAPQMVNIGPTEMLLVLLVVVLLFGAKRLPELARGSGRALRIFKSETRGLLEDGAAAPAPSADPAAEGHRTTPPAAAPDEHRALDRS